jgi:hypothetical protein
MEDTCEWEAAGFSIVGASDALHPVPAFAPRLTLRETAALQAAHKPYDDLGPDLWRRITEVIGHGTALVCQLDAGTDHRPELLLTVNLTLAEAQTVADVLRSSPPLRATSLATPLPTDSGVRVLTNDLRSDSNGSVARSQPRAGRVHAILRQSSTTSRKHS